MLEPERPFNDLPQVQDPDGGGQGAPLPQAEKVALPKVCGHPDAKAEEVLKRAKWGGAPAPRGLSRARLHRPASSETANTYIHRSLTVAAPFGKAAMLSFSPLSALSSFLQCLISNSGNGH
jgi:hypothetical protein